MLPAALARHHPALEAAEEASGHAYKEVQGAVPHCTLVSIWVITHEADVEMEQFSCIIHETSRTIFSQS